MTKAPTIAALQRLAQAQGYAKVTERAIREWRRRGLLPSRSSKAVCRGEPSSEPRPGEQLLALCRIRYERHVRELHHIAFWLWWERFEVAEREVLHVFEEAAAKLDLFAIRAGSSQGSGFAEEEPEERRFDDMRLFTDARRRVGKEHFVEFLEVLASGMVHGGLDEAQTELVRSGLSLPTMWALPDNLIGELFRVGPTLLQPGFAEEVREARPNGLVKTREALSVFSRHLQMAGEPIGDALRPGALAYIARDLRYPRARDVAQFILLWRRGRALLRPFGIDMDAMFEALAGAVATQLQVLEVCRAEIEDVGNLLSPRNVRRALKDYAYACRLFGLAQRAIRANRNAVERLLLSDEELQAIGQRQEDARAAWQRFAASLVDLNAEAEPVN
jgi:hypothetical protein